MTNLRSGSAEWLYDTLYCARGQGENLIKLHKGQLVATGGKLSRSWSEPLGLDRVGQD